MKWRQIVSIVSKNLKGAININISQKGIMIPDEKCPKDILLIDSKTIYSTLVLKLKIQSKIQLKVTKRFNFSEEMWFNIYLIPRIVLNNNKIKEFQYKILQQFLATNDLLYKMKKVNSNLYSFCDIYVETLNHLFYECFDVRTFWLNAGSKVEELTNNKIELTNQDIIFGYCLRENPKAHEQVNSLILYGKYYIWKCKINCEDVNFKGFKLWLKNQICINNKLEQFCTL